MSVPPQNGFIRQRSSGRPGEAHDWENEPCGCLGGVPAKNLQPVSNDAVTADVHERRLTHRLEAFSDIVMGFSLAQMSLSLVIPNRAAEVYSRPTQLVAFVFTFLIVAMTWYAHHRLFEYFFVARPLTVTMNFATLALVVWLVYQLQIYARFAVTADHTFAAASYALTFAVVWTLLGILYALCARIRWPELDAGTRRIAVLSIGRTTSVGIGTIVAVGILIWLRLPVEASFWLIPVWAILWRLWAWRTLAKAG